MDSVPPIDPAAEGTTVYDADGNRVGLCTGVDGDAVVVDPDPSTTSRRATEGGWAFLLSRSDGTLTVAATDVATVSDDRIVLRGARR
jgi:hypothetical protein